MTSQKENKQKKESHDIDNKKENKQKPQQNPQKQDNKNDLGITIKKNDDMNEWYSQVVIKSEMADYAPLQGFMIIRPLGYSIWQEIQNYFNKVLDKRNVNNTYFPLLIPESFFKREAKHAEGFSPELAFVKSDIEDNNDSERYALRPTSETIMYDSFSKWIRSWRDLPLRINQWANIVRWEVKQTKIFLRTREFLWQEGHCAYETEKQCEEEVELFLNEYKEMMENSLAIPVLIGKKSKMETFAGAKYTLAVESLMPDGKSLQCGTSHNLGENFAKAFNVKFKGRDEKEHYAFQSSWGFSTRLIGALIMTHGDDKGLVIPPKIAKNKIVIIPITRKENADKINEAAMKLKEELSEYNPIVDDTEKSPGFKFHEWELKGIPIRIEIGQRDYENNSATIFTRDNFSKVQVNIDDCVNHVKKEIELMNKRMLESARKRMIENIIETESWDEFVDAINNKKMVKAPFCNEISCEEEIKEKTIGATSRILDTKAHPKNMKCIHCRNKAASMAYFARSY